MQSRKIIITYLENLFSRVVYMSTNYYKVNDAQETALIFTIRNDNLERVAWTLFNSTLHDFITARSSYLGLSTCTYFN